MQKNCENCEKLVEENFDFCPYCSAPLTEQAKKLEETKAINAQLIMLATLIKETSDPKTLLILDKYVKLLSKNK